VKTLAGVPVPILSYKFERLPENTANMPVANAIRKARVQAAMTDEDDARAEEEGTLAQHLSQVFCVTCSFCGKQVCSSAAIGQAADYNDRFNVAALLVAKGWGAMTKTSRSRKLRPACPTCLKRKPRPPVRNRTCLNYLRGFPMSSNQQTWDRTRRTGK